MVTPHTCVEFIFTSPKNLGAVTMIVGLMLAAGGQFVLGIKDFIQVW